jgi:hypothetical protein
MVEKCRGRSESVRMLVAVVSDELGAVVVVVVVGVAVEFLFGFDAYKYIQISGGVSDC